MEHKRFTWIKRKGYGIQVVIEDSLTEKDLTPMDCYNLLNDFYEENQYLKQLLTVADEIIKHTAPVRITEEWTKEMEYLK